ncbi:MAG: hypothetical protein LBP58_05400 [Azoarcus sp.]|jgi:hypothetical protein|nr:hypothetical protein [Azoarcus sp.]
MDTMVGGMREDTLTVNDIEARVRMDRRDHDAGKRHARYHAFVTVVFRGDRKNL